MKQTRYAIDTILNEIEPDDTLSEGRLTTQEVSDILKGKKEEKKREVYVMNPAGVIDNTVLLETLGNANRGYDIYSNRRPPQGIDSRFYAEYAKVTDSEAQMQTTFNAYAVQAMNAMRDYMEEIYRECLKNESKIEALRLENSLLRERLDELSAKENK